MMKWSLLPTFVCCLAGAIGDSVRAETIIVLNSEEASYSLLEPTTRTEITRLPIGREPHHLLLTPDQKNILVGSTGLNELSILDAVTAERHGVVRDIVDS
jgi:DNA-binding beta-propeller fold protein YncE